MNRLAAPTFISFFFLSLALISTSRAAKEEWRYVTDINTISQIVADGEGGVAIIHSDPTNALTVVWLDFKGQEVFKKTWGQNVNPRILAVSKRGLTYWIEGTTAIVIVDARGRESEIPGRTYPVTVPFGAAFPTRVDDDAGVFVLELGSLSFPSGFLVRYKY